MFDELDEKDSELYFVPHLFGAGTPGMDQKEGAGLYGLRPDTARGYILRAAIEGLAFDIAAKALGWIQDYAETAQLVKMDENKVVPRKEREERYRQKYEKYREWDRKNAR